MYCRNCGAEIGVDMNFCPSCGFSVDGGGRTAANSQTNIMINHKSEGITILLSVIITGAGHMYAGKVKGAMAQRSMETNSSHEAGAR